MLKDCIRFKLDRLGRLSILHVIGTLDDAGGRDLETAMQDATDDSDGPLIVAFIECTHAAVTCLDVLMRQFVSLAARLSIVATPHSDIRKHIDLMMPFGFVPQVHDGFREAILAFLYANEVDLTTENQPNRSEICLRSSVAAD